MLIAKRLGGGLALSIAAVWLRFGEGRRIVRIAPTLLRSVLSAFRSPRFVNIFAAAAGLAALSRRFGSAANPYATRKRTFFVSVWALYYYFRVRERARIHFQRTSWNRMLVEKAMLTRRRFSPVFWAFNRHAQSITCFILSMAQWAWQQPPRVEREIVLGADGSVQHLDWLLPVFDDEDETLELEGGGGTHGVDDAAEGQGSDTEESHGTPRGQPPALQRRNRARTHSFSRARSSSSSGSGGGCGARSGVPIIILVHGLGDDVDHPYIKRFAARAHTLGWRVVVFSYWRFDFSQGGDLKAVVEHIHAQDPLSPLVAVAWSAGGHLLARYLQEAGAATPLVAAVTSSGCFDLPRATSNVRHNENPSYFLFLTGQSHQCAKRHLRHDQSLDAPLREALTRAAHLRDSKGEESGSSTGGEGQAVGGGGGGGGRSGRKRKQRERVDPLLMYDRFQYHLGVHDGGAVRGADTAEQRYVPYHQTAAHYRERTAISGMHKIAVTTLIIHADDDPVVEMRTSEWQDMAAANKNLIIMHTKRGGHCGWFDGFTPFGATWDCKTATAFISATLECHSQTNFLLNVISKAMAERGLLQGDAAAAVAAAAVREVAAPTAGAPATPGADKVGAGTSNDSGGGKHVPTPALADAVIPLHFNAAVKQSHLESISPGRLARICSASDLSALQGGMQ